MATRKTPSKKTPIKSPARTRGGPTPVDATKHTAARRTNIPTAELEPFARDEEKKTPTMLYPRDPSLDPQLVWKGKDEQDTKDLAVPVVPIYIQEKIAPRAIIEDLRAASQRATSETQLDLFGDFNGLEFEQLIEFYQHNQHWSNRMILGDSLLVMTSLAEKEGLKGQVQMIYMDPPYGIKFGSNWQVSTRKRDVRDGKVEDATRQPEQIRAFRDTWQLGIHSYLSYLRDRLVVARDLLTESGSIFVQIGDANVHLVRSVVDEVFGRENAVASIVFRTTANLVGNYLGRNSDYLLWYARSVEQLKFRKLFDRRTLADDVGQRYTRVELPDGTRRPMTEEERADATRIPAGARVYSHGDLTSQDPTPSGS
ncbi:MAG: site-specific DNA-methyltransferase, partial [Chloroflexota bacterium]|nr:site-specific DNA-methyltransferase [Chloroflexota bacterium]